MQKNFYTGNGLLYENYRRGLENRREEYDFEYTTEINVNISIPIQINITRDNNDDNNELRPLFRKAI